MKQFLFANLFCLLTSSALAHSPLEATTPADGAALNTVPSEITFAFKRKIRLTKVVWTQEERSEDLDLDGQTSFATDFALPFTAENSGHYIIEWRGLGDDGHAQKGSFSFVVE